MLKKILLGIAAFTAVAAIIVAMQPSSYHVERSTTINAPANVVWAEFSDFNRWKKWSHWEKSDPTQKTTITGKPGTVGHKTVWDGEKTGKGSMTVAAATKPTALNIKLSFAEPMASEAITDLKIEPRTDAVTVTWSIDGENNFMGKFFGLAMDMEGMIGKAYEDSLANLKQVAEDSAKVAAKARSDADALAADNAKMEKTEHAAPTP